jgi:hypothetical protein
MEIEREKEIRNTRRPDDDCVPKETRKYERKDRKR